MKKILLTTSISVLSIAAGFSQVSIKQGDASAINTINTAVPFLRISPDARSGAMGDVGIALTPDASSTYWNAAKLAFMDKDMGASITYTPWLKQLVNDIYLANLSFYKRIDKNQTIATSLRYFSLGSITFTDANGATLSNFNPKEFAWDVSYARKLSEHFSVAVSGRYIYSNLAAGFSVSQVQINAANGGAVDMGMYYKKNVKLSKDMKGLWAMGLNISNLGTKISYTSSASNKDYLPANIGIGTALKMDLDKFNTLELALDINKLLVPTPYPVSLDSTQAWKSYSPLEGAIKSLTDAPGGFKEKLKEFYYSFGAEYWYDKQFSVRTGVFYENPDKGGRFYMTTGIGVKYSVFGINFSYLVPAFHSNTNLTRSPLDNTLRFGLLFDFDALKDDAKNEKPAAM